MKLSTIWYKANRELTQYFGGMGNRSQKKACAYGAIFYYDAVDKSLNSLGDYGMHNMKQATYLTQAIAKFHSMTGSNIIELNDRQRWTFLEFARKARELKL